MAVSAKSVGSNRPLVISAAVTAILPFVARFGIKLPKKVKVKKGKEMEGKRRRKKLSALRRRRHSNEEEGHIKCPKTLSVRSVREGV